ncbi:MAG: hypothetical protein SPE00_06650 [Bacilli bacterium]|nr:hypothetical protein [Bacilli bacterium]
MYDIVNKISVLNLPKEVYPNIPKFYASFSDDLVTLEELKEKMGYLTSKGIAITKPSQVKVFSLPLDFIKSQVEQAEKLGLLDMFISDPTRISSTELFQRLSYVMSLNETLKDEKGKYSKILFNKKEFDRRYGVDYLTKEKDDNVKVETTNNNEENVVKEETISQTNTSLDDLNSEVEKAMNTITAEPIVENPVKDVEPVETHVEVASEPINESPVQEVTPVNNPSETEEINPYVMALSKEQTIRLDDEMLARFEDLTAHLKNVLITLGYSDEIDGTKSDNLIKLLTSGVTEKREILYYTLTYNKNLTDEEKVSIYKAIDNELKLTNNGELSL